MGASNREKEMRLLLANLLQDATRAFDREVHRAIVFLPDATGKHLRAWTFYQMPRETVTRSVFYIGKNGDGRRRGLAGKVYLEEKIYVAHITREKGQWRCDADCYIDFDKRRPFPPYHSLIGVPIIAPTLDSPVANTTTCLGVVCFDSQNPRFLIIPEQNRYSKFLQGGLLQRFLIYEQFQKLSRP